MISYLGVGVPFLTPRVSEMTCMDPSAVAHCKMMAKATESAGSGSVPN